MTTIKFNGAYPLFCKSIRERSKPSPLLFEFMHTQGTSSGILAVNGEWNAL